MVDINVDTTSQTITAQRGHVQALAFARKGGSALSRLLGNIASAKEKERTGPIETMLFLELNFSDDESAAIPVVGSKQGDTGNKPYDRYTASVKTADGTKKIPGSWFTDVIKATDDATVALHAIECCNDAATDGCPDYIKAMGTGARIAEKKRLRQRLADMRTALTKGSMLFHHAETVRTCNPERIEVKMPIRSEYVLDASGSRVTIDGVEQTRQVVYGNIIRLIDPKKEIEDL